MRRVVAPRPQTQSGIMDTARKTGILPDDLLGEQVQRLAVFAAVGVALWSYGLLVDGVLIPLTAGPAYRTSDALLVEVAGICLAILMFLYVRFSGHTPEAKLNVALVWMVLNAAGVAGMNTWTVPPPPPGTDLVIHLSWITIILLVFSMIAPATPSRMLTAAFIAASMDPLGVWIAHLRGMSVPSAPVTMVMCLPNYVCALLTLVPSRVLQHLGRRLREAQELGSYELVELLGRGGMGEVWRAEHRLLARSAAIKLVRPEVLGAATGTEARLVMRRFEREAQATASLSSPHTIHIFDYGMTDDGTFYYVMELLAGRDLESFVREFGPVPADRAIYLLRQVCHSLAEAHARGLVHRDIKPANVYVCRMGLEYDFVKVLDFGLVKYDGRASSGQTLMTMEQTTTGTPAYMAPEIILGEAEVDLRADVYAFGCVAYYLLTGQLVFEADTPMKMLLKHVHEHPIPPSRRTELPIPRDLDDLIMACLEKDPSRRPQNARELLTATRGCRSCETWTQAMAEQWWERHLPEVSRPLVLVETARESETSRGVVA